MKETRTHANNHCVENRMHMLCSHLHPAVFAAPEEGRVHLLNVLLVVQGTNKVAQSCCEFQ